MRKSALTLAGFVLIIFGLWGMADTLNLFPYDAAKFAISFTQLSGLLAIGMMAFATLLAVRPAWLESAFGGLDKMYRLHKWLGIGGMAVGVAHWLLAANPDGRHGPPAAGAAQASQSLLQSLHGPAHGVAQPALWIMLALVAIALIKKFPYHIFSLTHRLVPLVFLALAFHSAVLMKADYWSQPIGWLMGAIYLVGSLSALTALFRMTGLGRKVEATVIAKTHMPEVHSLLVDMQMGKGWKGHKPGQFAFVGSSQRWSAHPFTIASDWNPATGKISFIVKELGDATRGLDQKLPVGARLRVEGPYGRFNFEDSKPRQIWVSGGIGITPFVARMKELARTGGPAHIEAIDLFHSDVVDETAAYDLMKEDAARAGVKLHLNITPRHGRLTGARIREAVPNWKDASVWFCGPTAFAAALKLDLVRQGLKAQDFHHELFEMR
ncbi:MAG: ferric reductase-like transmembrane domain-containing protein [Alphaproteobacteria bacterium]|nr:ferric reductase-like transmembrane domain-containing protein [Alphaproteobacteria bacterium]